MDILLAFLTILRIVALIIGIGLGITYAANVYYIIDALVNGVDFEDIWFFFLINLYGIGFAVMIILCEVRVHKFFDLFNSFYNWAVRGGFYVFNGVLSLGMGASTFSFREINDDEKMRRFQEIIAYILMGIGAFLILGEILCLRGKASREAARDKDVSNIV